MPRSSVDAFAAVAMLVLCATWGAQQVAIKLAAPDVPPVVQVAVRFVLSAVLVAGFMGWRRVRPAWARTWRPGLLAGALFAVEFLLIAEGLRRTTASHMAELAGIVIVSGAGSGRARRAPPPPAARPGARADR